MEFPLNEPLIQETLRIKEERQLVRDRLAKIESTRGEVRASVYSRVQSDYSKRLDELSAALLAKKQEVERELATLLETRTKLSGNVDTQQEQLEELEFRHGLGEFDDAAFKQQSKGVKEKLQKFSTLLAAINQNIGRYEELFADMPELAGPAAPTTPPAASEPTLPDVWTEDEAEEELGDEPESAALPKSPSSVAAQDTSPLDHSAGDYFGGPQSTRVLESDTEVGTEPTPLVGPRLTLTRGQPANAVYLLEDKTTIGRSESNTIPLKEAKVSRQHAEIHRRGKKWVLTDLQSSNGVFVNGERITEAALHEGDTIQIGDFVLEFQL